MVDLHSQYLKIKSEIDNAIQNVINTSEFIKGSEVKKFEANLASYLSVKHVISCANGTDALQLALMALDLNAGDEIITANFTFIATAEVIALLGLNPVLVDVNPNTFTLDVEATKKDIETFTGTTLDEIDKDYTANYGDKYVFDEAGRKKFVSKFVTK